MIQSFACNTNEKRSLLEEKKKAFARAFCELVFYDADLSAEDPEMAAGLVLARVITIAMALLEDVQDNIYRATLEPVSFDLEGVPTSA